MLPDPRRTDSQCRHRPEIVRQRHLDAACDEGRGVAALIVVRGEEDACAQREPVVEVVVGLGKQLAVVWADVLGRIEIMDVAEIERERAELRPHPNCRIDLGAFEVLAEIDIGGPDVQIERSDARLDVALNGRMIAGVGNAARHIVGGEGDAEGNIKRKAGLPLSDLRLGFGGRRLDRFEGLLDGVGVRTEQTDSPELQRPPDIAQLSHDKPFDVLEFPGSSAFGHLNSGNLILRSPMSFVCSVRSQKPLILPKEFQNLAYWFYAVSINTSLMPSTAAGHHRLIRLYDERRHAHLLERQQSWKEPCRTRQRLRLSNAQNMVGSVDYLSPLCDVLKPRELPIPCREAT